MNRLLKMMDWKDKNGKVVKEEIYFDLIVVAIFISFYYLVLL